MLPHALVLFTLLQTPRSAPATAEAVDRLIAGAEKALAAQKPSAWLDVEQTAIATLDAVREGRASPAARAACPRLLLAVSDTASARYCLTLTGADPGMLPVVAPLKAPFTVAAKIHRLWDPATREPMVLASFAYTTPPTIGSEDPAHPNRQPSLQRLRFTMWDPIAGTWATVALDSTLRALKPAQLVQYVAAGSHYFPASTGATSWSVGAEQYGIGMGGRTGIDRMPPLSSERLFLSDVILGSRADRLSYRVGDDTVWLAPWNTVSRRVPLELFFQAGSDTALPGAVTALTVHEMKNGRAIERMRLTFAAPVAAGMTGVRKSLVISRLSPGTYRFDVALRDTATGRTATQSAMVAIR